MVRARRRWAIAAILGGFGGALAGAGTAPAAAQPMSCSAANVGQAVCQAEGICKCAYKAGGTMMREPPGYSWDCSLLYGKCAVGSPYPELAMGIAPGPAGAGAAGRAGSNTIRAAQTELARQGYKPGPIDGVMGPRTAGAISAFQRAQHLPETGTLTPETLGRLRLG
jgi:hypothetical protein